MHLRSFIVLVTLALAGCSPRPFEAIGDCPKKPNCGQCTSQGGCGWCGDQCMAVPTTACSSTLINSSDLCAPPPSGTIVP
jgi:hypothetical protein